MISLILIAIAVTVQESFVERFYTWPTEVDKGLLDTITVNVASYLSRVKDLEMAKVFLLKNLKVTERYNRGFRVLNYSIINMTVYSSQNIALVNVTIVYNLLWGCYCSSALLLVKVLNITEFSDPLTGEVFYKAIIICSTDRGKPKFVKGYPTSVTVNYLYNNIWVLTYPTSLKLAIIEDWRGIRVELKTESSG